MKTDAKRPWDGMISEEEQRAYRAAGFGRPGCTTSGCVRGSVVDAFAFNFRALVAEDAVYDRSCVAHAVNLFDMSEKYADVAPTHDVIAQLQGIGDGAARKTPAHAA